MCRITPRIKDEKISNFDIIIHRVVNLHNDSLKESVCCAEISLSFENGDCSQKREVEISKLENMNWSELDYRAKFCPRTPKTTASRYIANDIRSALENFLVTDIYRLTRPGLYKINGTPIFCTGREAIQPPASANQVPEIECTGISLRLDVDSELSEADAAAEVLNLISLSPNPGRIILSQMLTALMRQAYEDAGKAPSFCVFLYGASGMQKTTIASFLTQIYNRSNGIVAQTRLNASLASAVEILMDSTDQVVVFDDLFPAVSKQIRKDQEKTLSEITRYIGDGTVPARIKSGAVREGRPKCGVLFTGEYLIGEGSDAARLLPVEMSKPDTCALQYFQAQPLIVSTFYHNFILWFIERYDETVAYLKEWLNEYRQTSLGIHDRLQETHYFLNTAYSLMLEYCKEVGVLKENDVLRFHKSFVKMLNRLVREQNERVSPTNNMYPTQGNVLERIRELYRNNQLSIANGQFSDAQHDGIIHNGCLCLRPQALSHFFPGSDTDEIARKLETAGALSKGKDSLKKKISSAKGKYFYCIPLACL